MIKFRNNELLKGLSPDIVDYDPTFWQDEEDHYYVTQYRAASWTRARRLIIVAKKKLNEPVPDFQYFLTSLQSAPEIIVAFYRQRGQMENYIKETKGGFFADQMCSTNFLVNDARMMVGCLAYNLVQLTGLLVFSVKQRRWQIVTLRAQLLHIAASVADHARKIWVNLTRGHPGINLY